MRSKVGGVRRGGEVGGVRRGGEVGGVRRSEEGRGEERGGGSGEERGGRIQGDSFFICPISLHGFRSGRSRKGVFR